MPVADILSFADKHPASLVQITGGEPLLQEESYGLMEELVKGGRLVLLETNGSIFLDRVPAEVVKIMDLKCPDSLMSDRMELKNLHLLSPADELKCVIGSRQDYDWAVKLISSQIPAFNDHSKIKERVKILFSPVTDKLDPARLAQWILDDGLQVRLQLQLHTILWPGETRGF